MEEILVSFAVGRHPVAVGGHSGARDNGEVIAALRRHAHGAKLMLRHADADALAGGADHTAGNHQLKRRYIMQEDRPGNRKFDIEAGRQLPVGLE